MRVAWLRVVSCESEWYRRRRSEPSTCASSTSSAASSSRPAQRSWCSSISSETRPYSRPPPHAGRVDALRGARPLPLRLLCGDGGGLRGGAAALRAPRRRASRNMRRLFRCALRHSMDTKALAARVVRTWWLFPRRSADRPRRGRQFTAPTELSHTTQTRHKHVHEHTCGTWHDSLIHTLTARMLHVLYDFIYAMEKFVRDLASGQLPCY